MGRHRTPAEKLVLGERARTMRAEGRSRREIALELGIGDDLAQLLLRGTPLPDRLRRPQAKDDVRQAALALRAQGFSYNAIVRELGVSKASCSLWLRDIPAGKRQVASASTGDGVGQASEEVARQRRREGALMKEIAHELGVSVTSVHRWTWDLPAPPASRHGGDPDHMERMRRRRWDRVLAQRADERAAVHAAHAARITALSQHELEIAAVVAYWCEGTKSKPWKQREQVTFINSDPGLVRLFLAYLDQVGFPQEHRRFSLSIHETADVARAQAWWSVALELEEARFGSAMLKRHNPRTVRKNVDNEYVGCLVVRLVQCRELYQRIAGVWQGIMGALPAGGADEQSRVV